MSLTSLFEPSSSSDTSQLQSQSSQPPPALKSSQSLADMARRILVGSVASVLLASAGAVCPITDFSASKGTLSSITTATAVSIPSTRFLNAAKTALGTCTGQRVEITAIRIAETSTPAKAITANVVYKSATNKVTAVSLSTAATTCFDVVSGTTATTTDLSFTQAAANPDKTDAAVEITCATATSSSACNVDYDIIAMCMPLATTCVMPSGSIDVPTLASTAGKLALSATNFKAADGTTPLSSCVDTTKRLDITSVIVFETNGQPIKVNVGYQNSAATQVSVASLASGSCYQSASPAAVKAQADAYSDMDTPFVEVTCLGTAASCVLKYQVLTACVTRSAFPVLPSNVVVAKSTVATGSTLSMTVPSIIPLTAVVDAKGVAIPTCVAGTRLDILSAAFAEKNGATINANVKYQSVNTDLTKIMSVPVGSFTPDASSYSSIGLSFATKADSHPDKVTPVITLTCPSTTADCNVNYKIVGKCVPVSVKCPTMTSTAVDVPTATPLSPMIKETAAATVALTCTTGQRVDLVSMKVVETTGANINVIVGYQQDDAKKSVIKSASSVDCFDFGATDLSFAAMAPMNPGKVTPIITIQCITGTCKVQYEVIGKCVTVSPVCPTIAATAATVTMNTVKPFVFADFVAASAGAAITPTCTSSQRLEISAVKIVETTGANIDINIKYRTAIPNNLNPVTVKTLSGVACYTSTGTETTFSSQADGNPLHLDAVVEVKCLSTSVDCLVKYDIVASCVAKSTVCTAPIAAAKVIATGTDWTTVALTEFKDAATPASALSSCTDATKRLEIKSFKITETSGASVKVNFGYQKDVTHQNLVKSVSGISCYMSATDELRFTTANADANPFKVTPYVMIQCPATNAAACNVQYEVLAECVVASTKCASLTTTAQAITVGNIVEITPAKFVDTTTAKAALACTATQRADIQSVKVLEVNGNMINTIVKYQKDATAMSLVKNVTGVSCYESTGTTELSFAAKAAANYDYTNTIVAVECASSNAADCSVRYEIVANCVAQSPAPTPAPTTAKVTPAPTSATPAPTTTTKATNLASLAAATATDSYTRAIAMVVSIAAGGLMMYMRH